MPCGSHWVLRSACGSWLDWPALVICGALSIGATFADAVGALTAQGLCAARRVTAALRRGSWG